MKKSTIALGVIVALGAASVGGAWFTGQKAESEYLRQIEQANQQFQTLNLSDSVKLIYKNKQFERGFFTSQVEDEVVISLPKEGKVWTIPLSTKLYHGPFPLDQLAKFNLVPTMYSAQGVVGKNESTQPLFDFLKSDKPIQYRAATSYALNTKGAVELAGGEFADPNNPESKIAWSNINWGFDFGKDLTGKYNMTLDELSLNLIEDADADAGGEEEADEVSFESMKMKMKGMKIDGSFTPTKWNYLYAAKATSSTDYFEMNGVYHDGSTTSVIEKGIKGTSDISLNGDFLNVKSENSLDSLSIDGKELGKLTYNSELNHIEANAANALIEAFVDILKATPEADEEEYDSVVAMIMDNWLEKHGMAIFNNQPQIKLNPIAISDKQGKLALDLNVALAPNPEFDLMREGLYKQFTDFAINFQLDKASAENLVKTFAPEGESVNAAEAVEKFAQEGASSGMLVNGDRSVTMQLVLENGGLKLNGQPIPEEQARNALMMLAIGAMMQMH